ncbi:hypothetical protein ACQPYK_49530 (plasmid) [Streptosporangium sp. CA-135522]|uniref:hypothetical protein n=1 Tax=Streptosporangium sp. CA-135522 TaxID=3240072 RepID=UPI003D919ECD
MDDLFEHDIQYATRAPDGTITEYDLYDYPSHWNLPCTPGETLFRIVRTDHYAHNRVADVVSDWHDLPRGHTIQYGTRNADGQTAPVPVYNMNTRRMHLQAHGLHSMAGEGSDIVVRVAALDQHGRLTAPYTEWITIPS